MTERKRLRTRLRADANSGSAAIEFAFVAPVFFVILMGIFEAGLLFFSQAALQNAVTTVSRTIRTGQAQTGSVSQGTFRTNICNKVTPLIACDGNLQINVESYPSYATVPYNATPLNTDKTLNTNMNKYLIGGPCDVVLVRAFYTATVYTPVMDWFLVNMAGNKHLATAAAAFRNEPYTTTTGGC